MELILILRLQHLQLNSNANQKNLTAKSLVVPWLILTSSVTTHTVDPELDQVDQASEGTHSSPPGPPAGMLAKTSRATCRTWCEHPWS